MDVFLIRHAEAAEGGLDAARPLTTKGCDDFARVVRGLGALDVKLARVCHSPLLRAAQTAELLAPLLSRDGVMEATPLLAEPPSTSIVSLLEGDGVALVGHQPWMAELLAMMLHGSRTTAVGFDFKKGAVAWLEGSPALGHLTLRAFLPPSVTKRVK